MPQAFRRVVAPMPWTDEVHAVIVMVNVGPATALDSGTESAAAVSLKSRLGNSRPAASTVPATRKLVGETITITTAATTGADAAAVPVLRTKSSVKSRLGEPVESATHDAEPRLMISTKRKLVDETVSSATAGGMQAAKMAKLSTRLSVKSRLGEQATAESQPRVQQLPGSRTLAAAAGGGDNEQLIGVVLPQYKTVFSRLGHA